MQIYLVYHAGELDKAFSIKADAIAYIQGDERPWQYELSEINLEGESK